MLLWYFLSLWVSSFAALDEVPWARLNGAGRTAHLMRAPEDGEGHTGNAADTMQILTSTWGSFHRVFAELENATKDHVRDYESQCLEDFRTLFSIKSETVNVSKGTQAIDALGKPGSNILFGNLQMLGSFDECFDIGEDLIQYWVVPFNLVVPPKTVLPLHMGMCLPRSCNGTDLEYFVNVTNGFLHSKELYIVADISNIESTRSKNVPLNAGGIAMVVVCAIFLALAVVGSTVDMSVKYLRELLSKPEFSSINHRDLEKSSEKTPLLGQPHRNDPKEHGDIFSSLEKPLEFITAFSLFKNVPMILSTKQPPTAITSLNGIRVISMFWVIVGHTFFWTLSSAVLTNPLSLGTVASRFSMQAITNGFFSVDSFFFLSGALVAYLTLREMKRKGGRFPVITYYLHRYLRLTMVYAFLLFFWWALTMYLGNGSHWLAGLGEHSILQQNCEKYWWTNLLYINNFYPWQLADECMGWTWYLANDMQFYVIAPLILIPLYYFFPIGLLVGGVLLIGSFVANGAIAGTYRFSANVLLPSPHEMHESDDIYIKPYCRVAPYLVGLALGYVLFKKFRISIHWFVDWLVYLGLWLVAAGCCFSTVYGLYSSWHGHNLSLAENVSYYMFSRFVWSLGLALMVFACHYGYGWVINDFLSMKVWIPLSRLTYTAYLIHPIIMTVIFASLRDPFTYTDYTIAVYAVAMVVLSFGAAGVVATFVEFPLSNLEMALFKAVGLKLRESTRHANVSSTHQDTLLPQNPLPETEKNSNIQD